MAKLTLVDITSLEAQASAIQTLNANAAATETALENTLSRDGTSPNQMEAPLDLNDNRILNVGAPQSGSDAARLIDVQDALAPEGVLIPALQADKILSSDGDVLVWLEPADISGFGDLLSTNNLSDLTNIPTARTNLGLGTAAIVNVGTSGATIGLLNGSLTFSGNNLFTGFNSFAGDTQFGGVGDHRLTGTPSILYDDSIGFRGAPINLKDATYTLALLDSGKTVLHTSASAHTWTIPPNSSVAYPIGSVVVLANIGAGAVTVSRGAGVALRIGGTSTDKNMTIAQHGIASILKLDTNSWYISGTGVS